MNASGGNFTGWYQAQNYLTKPLPVNRDTLYTASYYYGVGSLPTNASGQVSSARITTYGQASYGGSATSTPPDATGAAAGGGLWTSSMAVDANSKGARSNAYAYLWGYTSDITNQVVTALRTSGVTNIPSTIKDGINTSNPTVAALYRVADNQTTSQYSIVPLPTFFGETYNNPSLFNYWSGGEVNQQTGEIMFGGGELTCLAYFPMMKFNPANGDYNFSGNMKPASSADNIFGTTMSSCGYYSSYVASDMALDANGNAYLIVSSTAAAPTFGVSANAGTYWLVRVTPGADDGSTPWTYELVTPLSNASGNSPRFTGYGIWGLAFYNGSLYAASASGMDLARINPMSGQVYNVPGNSGYTSFSLANVTTTQNLLPPFLTTTPIATPYDFASGQTAFVVQGTVTDDASGEPLPGEKVAIYMEDPNNGGAWTFEGYRITNTEGHYSFLVAGNGQYVVRLVNPTVNGIAAWQTSASVNGVTNIVTAQCQAGGVNGAGGVIASTSGTTSGACDGAQTVGYTDPAMPANLLTAAGSDTSTQPSAMAMYATVDISTDDEVATADFGVTAIPDPTKSTLTLSAASAQVGANITATARIVDSNNTPLAGITVTFTSASGDTTITGANGGSTCTTGADGTCTATVTSSKAGAYTAEVHATVQVGSSAVDIKNSPADVAFTVGPPVAGPYGPCSDGRQGTGVYATPTTVQVGGVSTVTGLVTDAQCDPVSGAQVTLTFVSGGANTLTIAATDGTSTATPTTLTGVTGADGTIKGTVSSPADDTVAITGAFTNTTPAASGGMGSASVTFEAGSFSGSESTLTVSPVVDTGDPSTWVDVGGSYTATLYATDSVGTPIDNLNVSQIAFTPSDPSVQVSSPVVNAGGGTYTVTLTGTKAGGSYTVSVADKGVAVVDSGGATVAAPIPFRATGPAVGPFHCTGANTVGTNISASPSTVTVDGSSTVTVLVTDLYCDPLPGVTVSLSTLIGPNATSTGAASTTATLSNTSPVTGPDGKVTVTLTDTAPQTVTVRATVPVTDPANLGSTAPAVVPGTNTPKTGADVLFTTGAPVAGPYGPCANGKPGTGLTASPALVAIPGSSAITQLVTDQYCNPVANVPVALTQQIGPNAAASAPSSTTATLVMTSGSMTGPDGKVTATLRDTAAQTITVTSTLTVPDPGNPGSTMQQSGGTPADVEFEAGVPAVSGFSCVAPYTNGSGISDSPSPVIIPNTSTTEVLITDANCVPLPGVPVTLDVTGSATINGSTGPVIVTTGDGTNGSTLGVATVVIADSDPETVTVSATTPVPNPANPSTTIAGTVPGTNAAKTGADVKFVAGSPSVGPFSCASSDLTGTNISATPSLAAVTGESVASILVTDANCLPIPGVAVTVATTGAARLNGVAGTVTATTGDGHNGTTLGVATVVVTDTTPQTVTVSAKIPVPVPSNPNVTTQTTVPGTNTAGTGADVTFEAGTPSVGPFSCVSPYTTGSGISDSPSPVIIPNTSTTEILVTDANCVPLPGLPVTVNVTGSATLDGNPVTETVITGDGRNGTTLGVATVVVANATPEIVTVTATTPIPDPANPGSTKPGVVPGSNAAGTGADVTFQGGATSVGPFSCQSPFTTGTNISASPTPLPVTAQSTATILVTDANCVPIPGVTVTVSVTGSAQLNGAQGSTTVVTGNGKNGTTMGVATVQVADTTAQTVTVSATVPVASATNPGVTTPQTVPGTNAAQTGADVTFQAGAPVVGPVVCPAGSGLTGTNLSATSPVGLTSQSTITALITDQYCNPVPGVAVTLTKSSTTATFGSISGTPSGTTGSDGIVTATLANTVAQAVYVTATIPVAGSPQGINGSVATVVFQTAPSPRITSPTSTNTPTNNATPTISGDKGEPGQTVTVTNTVGGASKVVCTATVNPDGTWSCVASSALPEGTNTLTATQTNADGTSVPSAPVTVVVDTLAPGAPVITEPTNTDAPTSNKTPVVAGTADPSEVGGTVTVKDTTTGQIVCTATILAQGAWSCTPTAPLADGTHTITATETDRAGNVGAASAPVTFTVDSAAPPAPRITSPTSRSRATNVNTPTIRGDKGKPGAAVTVTNSEGGNQTTVCTTTVKPDGTWSCAPSAALPDGVNTLTATQTDPATGESGPSNPVLVVVDTQPPAAPTITSPTDGSSSNNKEPTVVGTSDPSEAGSTVTVKDTTTGETLCTAIVQLDGSWSCTSSVPLGDGDHSIVAIVTDAAGNTGPVSDPVDITIEPPAPDAPVITSPTNADSPINDNSPTIEGSNGVPGETVTVTDTIDEQIVCTADVESDGTWSCTPDTPLSEGTHQLVATQPDPETGVVSGPSAPVTIVVDTTPPPAPIITTPESGDTPINDDTPTTSGTTDLDEAGGTVTVEDTTTGETLCTAVIQPDGSWSCTPTTPLDDGSHTIIATDTDEAGNTGPASDPIVIVVDTTPPAAPTITSPTSGGAPTQDTTPTIAGTSDPAEAGGTVTVTETTTGATVCTAVIQSDGSWSCTPSAPLGDGTHTLAATATDVAGNTGPASTPVTIQVDTTPPAAPVITGPATGATVVDAQPVFVGTTDPTEVGGHVAVTDDATGQALCTAPITTGGAWTCTSTVPLGDGDHVITATETDAAGNVGATSDPHHFTVDTNVSPAAPRITSPTNGGVPSSDTTPTISGDGGEPGATITVVNTVGGATQTVCTAIVRSDGTWSCVAQSPLPDGVNTLTALVPDPSTGTPISSEPVEVVISATLPVAPHITSPSEDSFINTNVPTIAGTADPNEVGATVTVMDTITDLTLCSTTVHADGAWSCTPEEPLGEGPHTITAYITDLAGNESSFSDPYDFTVITTKPTPPTVDPTNGDQISGTTDEDTTVTVTDDAGEPVSGCEGIEPTATGHYSCTPEAPLEAGSEFTVTATDPAGNQSSTTAQVGQGTTPTPSKAPTGGVVDGSPSTWAVGAMLLLVAGCAMLWRRREG